MKRLSKITFLVGLVASLAPAAASAQQYAALRDSTEPIDDSLAGRTAEAELELPELPPVTERRQRWVSMLTRVAEHTLRCETVYGEREGEYYEDESCYERFDTLSTAGVAGVHAMGQVLLSRVEESDLSAEENRMIMSLGQSGEEAAAPYLIHLLARGSIGHARNANHALEQLAQVSLAARAAWQPAISLDQVSQRNELSSRWLAWYAAHGDGDRDSWTEAGLQHAQAQLESDDRGTVMWAIQHLVDSDRAADAMPALRNLIADPLTSAEGRRFASRFARQRGLLRREEARVLVRAARSAVVDSTVASR